MNEGNKSGSRKGKHRQGKVRMGLYVEARKKAIAVYLADLLDITLTDVIWQGIENLAIKEGVITGEGKITAKHLQALKVVEEIVKKSEVNG